MSDNDINDANCGSDCGSCGGDDSPCCDSGNSHKQADLKMLVFVLVLILAGAVAAHSIFNEGKKAGPCGPSGCPSTGTVDQTSLGGCPVTGGDVEKVFEGEDASIEKCPMTDGDISSDPK